ncbi:MAG TPA: DUF4234 domain-containing protein [Acidimicrobiales bacterium]|nr:DUF4234 domain-containing protein [Acidimicrobiales bacterium]
MDDDAAAPEPADAAPAPATTGPPAYPVPGQASAGPPVASAPPGYGGGPPSTPPVDRAYGAWQRRPDTDYIFSFWSALGWSILTLGIYGFYVFYQLVRRVRDHNTRRTELFEGALGFAWDEAGRRGLQEELTPSFQRAEAHMDVLRRMREDFRDPVVWLLLFVVLSFVTGLGFVVAIIAFVLLDKDLVSHDRSEVGVEYELSLIFGRFGQAVPPPDQNRVKGEDNYVGRIVATVFSLGIYGFWWLYDQMEAPNRNFEGNWPQEDALMAAVGALR